MSHDGTFCLLLTLVLLEYPTLQLFNNKTTEQEQRQGATVVAKASLFCNPLRRPLFIARHSQ